jgi:hypothetical protein
MNIVMSISTIFPLYCSSQFCWWMKGAVHYLPVSRQTFITHRTYYFIGDRQSSKWKFEFTGQNQILEFILIYRVYAMLWFFIFIIFNLEHKWTRLMLCPLRNTFRKTHESSRKPIKTISLKPGDGITLMHIFYLSGKIPENTLL